MTAIEKLPNIEDLLVPEEKAQQDVDVLKTMAYNLRQFQEMMKDEGLKESDPIPGQQTLNGKPPRTFGEQFRIIKKAWDAKWKRIDDEGYRALVEQKIKNG